MEKLQLIVNSGIYICEKGDTLKSIAKKFSTTERIIMVENNLIDEPNENTILYVKKLGIVYEVEIEDTPEKIAKSKSILFSMQSSAIVAFPPFSLFVFKEMSGNHRQLKI